MLQQRAQAVQTVVHTYRSPSTSSALHARTNLRREHPLSCITLSRRHICCGAAAQAGQPSNSYSGLTEKLVGFSSLPFTFIVVPQVLQNYSSIQAGQLSALAAISWIGWVAGLAGNSMMCTYLAAKREATAVNVQLIGIVSNLVVLSQLWYAHVMPTNAFAGVLAASLAVSVAGTLQSRGKLTDRQWMPFEALVGSAGVAAAPQVCCATCVPQSWQIQRPVTGSGVCL